MCLLWCNAKFPSFKSVQKTVEVPQSQFLDRVVGVPVVMRRQVPQELEYIDEETDVTVPRVMEDIIGVAKHGPQEQFPARLRERGQVKLVDNGCH